MIPKKKSIPSLSAVEKASAIRSEKSISIARSMGGKELSRMRSISLWTPRPVMYGGGATV